MRDTLELIVPDSVTIGGGPPEIVISYDQVINGGPGAFDEMIAEATRRGLTVWDEPMWRQYRIGLTSKGGQYVGT